MTVIRESRLTFTFDPACQAVQYDDWAFYRNQFQKTCGGAKAVDILCVEGQATWLIEIKDYRGHRRTKVMDVGDEVAIKARDTLAGLVAAKCHATDAGESAFARAALRSGRLRVILHLEQPRKHSRLFPRAIDPADVKQKLKQRVKAIDPHPKVVDQGTLSADMNWTVTG